MFALVPQRKKSIRRVAAIGLAIVAAAAASWFTVFAQQPTSPQSFEPTAFQESACLAFGAARTARQGTNGPLRFIGTDAGFPLTNTLGQDARTPAETAARGFLSVCGSLFGLSGVANELALVRATTTDDQRSVVRFQQSDRGIPVFGGEIIVHLDRNRDVVTTIGKILPRGPAGIVPTIASADAARIARELMAKVHAVAARDLSATTPELWVYDESMLGHGPMGPRLVWRTELTAGPLQPIRELVLIDAIDGSVALHFNQIETALQRQTYTANNTTTLPGTLVCDESNPTCAGGDAHAVSAHLSAGDTYNFYFANHGRDGIDGAGGMLRSTVHYSFGYQNAFWDPILNQMVYGDGAGFALADDVVGHELTHGVTQYSSGLLYYYQSGAINESFSDMWGEFIDLTNGRGNDAPGVRWQLGEDISGLGAIRSMSNPPAYGDPDRMTSSFYSTSSGDNGGVHTNSGINNKAAYLMVDGGTFNNQTIAGLGITKTAKIYYEAQTNLLTSGADYADLHDALFQACNNLVGTSGIVADDCQQVRNATLAVEMHLQPVTNFNLEAPVCAPGQAPTSVFFDDLEAGSANFVTMVGAGVNRWTYDSTRFPFAHSGRHFLYANDLPSVVADSSIAMANSITLPPNAFLRFAHAYGFEDTNFDGGVIEFSIDGGTSWVDAGSLFDNGGYNGIVASGWQNPLAGRNAFVNDSHGYIASRLNLSSLAGQSVKFRWRMGLDVVGSDHGWWLDDVRVYTCSVLALPSAPTDPSPGNGATGVPVTGTLTWNAPGASTYDVALGTSNPPSPSTTGLTNASYTPSLAPNTTYFWQVTARNSLGTAVGPVWSFTTGALPADLLVLDGFTGTGLLTTHTPDVNVGGASWIVTGGTPSPTLVGGYVGVGAGSGHLQATVQTAAPNVRMAVDYHVGSGPQLAALAFRLTDANNHLLLMFYQNALHFYRRQAGVYTLLASSAPLPAVAAGTTQRLEVRASGTLLTGWWNGVQRVQVTEAFQQTATRHGLDWNSAYSPTTTFDNLEIRNIGTALSPPSFPSNPTPSNGATSVSPSGVLGWTGPGAASYDLAFGTMNPPPLAAQGLSDANYQASVAPGVTYYWQVTARNGAGTAVGPVWSFTTQVLSPDFLVADTFSGPDLTLLTAHLPELNVPGGGWSVTGGTPVPTLSGSTVGVTPGSGHVQATLQTGAPDIRMGADYLVGSGPQLAALVFRLTDANNHLLLMFYQGALHFYRKEAGAYVLLASSAPLPPVASGTRQRIEVRTSGTQLTGWWNGAQVVAAIDSVQQTATRHGLDWNSAFDPNARFDNLEIWNNGAPTVAPGLPANPYPANNATSVSTLAALTWTASGAASYDVAFGTVNPPPPAVAGLNIATYTPAMTANTTYYWQVIARNAIGSTAGPIWSFTTGASPVDVLVSDTFTGTGLLTAHTPDVNAAGAPWIATGGTPIPTLSNGVVGVTTGSGHVQATIDTGARDIRMGVDYRVGSGPRLAALAFRLTDANNHLLLMFYQGALHFYRKQAGAYVLLASSGLLAPVINGTTQRLEVRASGSQLTGWWNGGQVVEATDVVQQTATRHGLDWNSAFDATTTFDNFEIRNIGTQVVPPTVPASPTPVDAASGVSTTASLGWNASGATSYDVAFGTISPPPSAATGLSTASYSPEMVANTTYYWQVTAHNFGGSTTGPVWSFTTGANPIDLLAMDHFTGSGPLTAHVPDVNFLGGPWMVSGGPPDPTLSGGGVGITAGNGHVQATLQTGAPDIRMSVDYRVGSGPQLAALAFRLTDANNHLLLMFYQNALHLYRRRDGVYTLMASSAPLAPISPGSVQRLEVRASGLQVTGWWNGVQVVQAIDVFQLTATRHGLDWNAAFDTTTTFDNLEIRNLGAPPVPPNVPTNPSPADNAASVTTYAILVWSAAGATSYDVAFGTVNPPPPAANGLTFANYAPALAPLTTYYWQVTARNAVAAVTGPVWSFTTDATIVPPGLPTLINPIRDDNSVGPTTELSWNATGATSYDLSFWPWNGGVTTTVTGLTTTSYAPGLAEDAGYYWQVTARNAGGSTTAPLSRFKTALQQGELLVSDTFSGAAGSLSAHAPDVNTSGAPWVVVGASPNPTIGDGLASVTSGTGHVVATIDTGQPDIQMGVSYIVRPSANSQRLAALAFRLTDANNYLLLMYYQNALHFYRRQAGTYILLASSAPVGAVFAGTVQRLEVRTFQNQLTGWWNGVQVLQTTDSFQQTATRHGLDWNSAYDSTAAFDNLQITKAPQVPPAIPTAPSPVDGATGVGAIVTMSWSAAGATSYDVAIDINFNPPLSYGVWTGLTHPTLSTGFGSSTPYRWRVTARNDRGSTVGPWWTFTTAPAPTATNPNPPSGSVNVPTNATLTWSAPGATSYDVYFGTVDFPPLAAINLTTASYTPTLAPNTTYYWRVLTYSQFGSRWGPAWTFTTGP